MRARASVSTVLAVFLIGACATDGPTGVDDGLGAAAEQPVLDGQIAATFIVTEFPAGPVIPGASAWMARLNNGVNVRLRTYGLTPGHAYTLWIVPFNNPEVQKFRILGRRSGSERADGVSGPRADARSDMVLDLAQQLQELPVVGAPANRILYFPEQTYGELRFEAVRVRVSLDDQALAHGKPRRVPGRVFPRLPHAFTRPSVCRL